MAMAEKGSGHPRNSPRATAGTPLGKNPGGKRGIFPLPSPAGVPTLGLAMKKLLGASLAIALSSVVVTSVALADIHEPPKTKYTKTRKLARGVSNIVYGWSEIPTTMYRWGEKHTEQSTGIWFAGLFQGTQRAGARLMYGFYEVWNWQKPLYKDTYKAPYPDINYLPWRGYEEFPPQIGELTTVGYVRGRTW